MEELCHHTYDEDIIYMLRARQFEKQKLQVL
jgi:hypothetical protein